jgi:hypothetical protein
MTRALLYGAGALAVVAGVCWYLDRRNAAAAGVVTTQQAGAVAMSDPLGWFSPLLPLRLQGSMAETMKLATLKV